MKRLSNKLPTLVLGLTALLFASGVLADMPPQRKDELMYLLKHDCGSCHGMRLHGGLGPALTKQRLEPYTVEQLAVTILYGRPGTPMPPWRTFINDAEAHWLATELKKGIQP